MGQVDRSLTSTDPPALRSEKQEARGLHPDRNTFFSEKHKRHSKKHSDAEVLSRVTKEEEKKSTRQVEGFR